MKKIALAIALFVGFIAAAQDGPWQYSIDGDSGLFVLKDQSRPAHTGYNKQSSAILAKELTGNRVQIYVDEGFEYNEPFIPFMHRGFKLNQLRDPDDNQPVSVAAVINWFRDNTGESVGGGGISEGDQLVAGHAAAYSPDEVNGVVGITTNGSTVASVADTSSGLGDYVAEITTDGSAGSGGSAWVSLTLEADKEYKIAWKYKKITSSSGWIRIQYDGSYIHEEVITAQGEWVEHEIDLETTTAASLVARFYANRFANSGDEAQFKVSVKEQITITNVSEQDVVQHEEALTIKKDQIPDLNQINDLDVVLFGDSITEGSLGTTWATTFNSLSAPNSLINMGLGAATVTWLPTTVETSSPSGDNKVFWNTIKEWESDHPTSDPDIIIIAYGTNDINMDFGSYEGAFAQDIASTGQLDLASATRKALHYLTENYPNAQIFWSLPLQSSRNDRTYVVMHNIGNIIRSICKRYNVTVIESTDNSGIIDQFEVGSSQGRYLLDGLHPDANGSALLGTYISHEVIKNYVR